MDDPDGKEEGQGNDEGPGTGNEADNGQVGLHIWLSAVEAVSDLTKYDWEKTFKMSAMEFFAFLQYYNYKTRKQEAAIRKLRMKK